MIQKKSSQQQTSCFNDESFVGFSDADGCLFASARVKRTKSNEPSFSSSLYFSFEQARFNEGNCLEIKKFLNCSGVTIYYRKRMLSSGKIKSYVGYKVNIGGAGYKVLDIYNRVPPVFPGRLKQYLAVQFVLTKIKRGNTRSIEDTSRTLTLLEWLSQGHPYSNLPKIREKMEFSSAITAEGNKRAAADIQGIEKKIQHHESNLLNNKIILSNDYLRGFHCGDGGLTVIYSVSKTGKVRFILTWTLTNISYLLLLACKNSIGKGIVRKLKTDSSFQYSLCGQKNFKNYVFPLFQHFKFPSLYKQKQWDIVSDAYRILENNQNLTSQQAWISFINLTYAIADTPKRKRSKKECIELWEKNKP
jgi:hypothetical protein